MWVWWVLGGLLAWCVVALLAGVVIGRGIRIADQRSDANRLLTTAHFDREPLAGGRPAPRRRRLPLPPIGVGLAAGAVVLEGIGFVDRLTGETSAVLSMDAPYSVPRLYVAGLFAAAALAAVAGASAVPGRRTWWTAVGVIGALIAAVKAGSTVHADALNLLTDSVGPVAALLISVLLAASAVGALWILSRSERRDRRRVLGSLAGYAVAAVGLSAVSGIVAGAYGWTSSWAAGATFVEESGEALGGVAMLIAVLAGVAPRIVLPAAWPLRRQVDAQTLDLPEQLPAAIRPGDAR